MNLKNNILKKLPNQTNEYRFYFNRSIIAARFFERENHESKSKKDNYFGHSGFGDCKLFMVVVRYRGNGTLCRGRFLG